LGIGEARLCDKLDALLYAKTGESTREVKVRYEKLGLDFGLRPNFGPRLKS